MINNTVAMNEWMQLQKLETYLAEAALSNAPELEVWWAENADEGRDLDAWIHGEQGQAHLRHCAKKLLKMCQRDADAEAIGAEVVRACKIILIGAMTWGSAKYSFHVNSTVMAARPEEFTADAIADRLERIARRAAQRAPS